MLNKNFIKNKIGFIQKELNELIKYKDFSFDEIAKSFEKHTIVERIIERIVNDAIDINQHIIKENQLELPNDFKGGFLKLKDLNIYSEKFADEISQSAGLRNIITHQYRDLDEKIFYNSIKDCLEQYNQYCDFILKYLEK